MVDTRHESEGHGDGLGNILMDVMDMKVLRTS